MRPGGADGGQKHPVMGTSTKLQAEEPPVELMGLHFSLLALCCRVPAFKGRSRTRGTKGQKEEKQFCREETSFPPPFFCCCCCWVPAGRQTTSFCIDRLWPAGEQQLGFESFRFKFTLNSFETAPRASTRIPSLGGESRVGSRLFTCTLKLQKYILAPGLFTI